MLLLPGSARAFDCTNYPIGSPNCPSNFATVSDSSPARGQRIVFSGCCFIGRVDIFLASTPRFMGSTTADSNGEFAFALTIPNDISSGTHELRGTGTGINGQPLTVRATIVISGKLTPTGTNTIPFVLVGLGVIVIGGAAIGLTRKKSS
jgi:LPXTG-motif cell wall-anchored protein